jgi:CheY-like chemotaxis protein
LPIVSAPVVPVKKKRVLLVDTCRAKRDIRSETMRNLGMEVDCAADLFEARCWWRADLYNLVLFHVEEESRDLHKFCDDIRGATPAQAMAFLVGKPEYLAASLEEHPSEYEIGEAMPLADADVPATIAALPRESWGILEACRRIAAARYLSSARTRALRTEPLPPRDSEKQERQRRKAESAVAAESQAVESHNAELPNEGMQ